MQQMSKRKPASEALTVTKRGKLWIGQFRCMASPCEVLIECDQHSEAKALIALAQQEANRIEQKFSRYLDDNIIHQINNGGERIAVDAETARLLDFVQQCYRMSEGWFDITSGILRRAWNFSQDDRIPTQTEIDKLLPNIGWDKVNWENPNLTVPPEMEIDLGGIGKEYAVDSVLTLLNRETENSFMVNFGGDCCANGPMADGASWMTGIENPHRPGDSAAVIQLQNGALATSGDVFKFIQHQGIRYGHILNPKTGWPNTDAPLSVTVAAATCTEAGVLSTLAMLQGKEAEQFLDQQGIKYWCYR